MTRRSLDPMRKAKTQLIATPSGGYSLARKVSQANRWRESYNPLRGLTLSRAVSLLEGYYRGEMADLQWTYYFIEQTDPDLFALVERRTSAICALDWDIKLVPERKRGKDFDEVLAGEQRDALREAYDRIDNFAEAIEHLALATFRGFAHLEKHYDGTPAVVHLEPLDPWNVVRDGLRGAWKYNPDARPTTFQGLPEEMLLDPRMWVIRETKRHVNRIGLIKFIRQNLSQKDWDAFIEIYGIPGVIIVGPPNLAPDKETEFATAAKDVAEGGSGYLPHGSTAQTSDGPRGVNPFRDHLKYLQEQLILAGTGGLLTMLTQSGSGTLAGSAHQETFDLIARSEAERISEVMRVGFDIEVLSGAFPDKPQLAYFDLAAGDQVDPGEVIDHVGKLAVAGYRVDVEEVSEKTGYRITTKSTEDTEGGGEWDDGQRTDGTDDGTEDGGQMAEDGGQMAEDGDDKPLWNRATMAEALMGSARDLVAKAVADDLQPLVKRLERILQIEDPEVLRTKLEGLKAELPQLLKDINADPAAAKIMADTFSAALLNGVDAARPIANAFNAGQQRDSLGRWVDENGGGLSQKDNLKRGEKALDRALRQRADVAKAMYHSSLGQIDFVWGTPGVKSENFAGGFGMSHILAKHGEGAVRRIPQVISRGKMESGSSPEKREIVDEDSRVVLVRKNSRSAWVLTGYSDRRQVQK